MKKTRTIATLIIILTTTFSCSTGKKNYFQDSDSLGSVPSSYIYPSTSTQKRKPSSFEENIFKLFSEHMSVILKSAKSEAAPTLEVIDRSVARTVRERFPSLIDKEYKNTAELFADIKKLKTPMDIQADALAKSIKSLSQEFGIEASAGMTALRQTYLQAGLRNLLVDTKTISKFDVKNTESTAGTFLNDLREKSASGEIYTFVIGGKSNELIKAKDVHGKTVFDEAKKMVSTDGALSGYHFGISFRRSEIQFMNVETRKEFAQYLRTYRGNHPESGISADVEVFRTQASVKQRLIVLDSFIEQQMIKGKRVALRMDDAHLYLGDPNKGGTLDHDILDRVLKWKNENPASLDSHGNAHFTNLIMTDDIAKLHPDITTDQAIAAVPFPLPTDDDIIEFVEQLMTDPAHANVLEKGYTTAEFAQNATGLQLREIKLMVADAAKKGKAITADNVLKKAKESIEKMVSKYVDSEGKSFIEVQIVDDIDERVASIDLANENQINFIYKKLDYRFNKEGPLGFDEKASKGILLIGAKGSGKTTMALQIARKRKAILITMTKYSGIYHDSAVGIAADMKNLTHTLRNVVFFFDEIENMPSTIGKKGINESIEKSNNAAAGIWKVIIADAPLSKTGSMFIGATANPQMLGTEFIRQGRFNPAIPLTYLTEVPQRRKVLDQLFDKYRNAVGDIKSDAVSDEVINLMPVINSEEMELLLQAAIKEKKDAAVLSTTHIETALQKIAFQRTDINDMITTELNTVFYTSTEARDLLPEYIRKMDPSDVAHAKADYQSRGIIPNWDMPTWISGTAKKRKVGPQLNLESSPLKKKKR